MRRGKWIAILWFLMAFFAHAPPTVAGVVEDIVPNSTVTGTILVAGDADEYRFETTALSKVSLMLTSTVAEYPDLGLQLLDPLDQPVDLTLAVKYRDRIRQIQVSSLTVQLTGTYRILVTADRPCTYELKLTTKVCQNLHRHLRLGRGGTTDVLFAAPEGSRLELQVRTRTRSRAHPRFGLLNETDLSQAGSFNRWRHRVVIRETSGGEDYRLQLRELSGFGGPVEVTVKVRPPAALKGWYDTQDRTEITSVVPGDRQVRVEWMPTIDAASYTLYWSNQPGVTPETGTAIPGITDPFYVHTGLQNGLAYYYAVSATCAQHQEREHSCECCAVLAPDAPTGIALTAGDGQAHIRWNAAIGADETRIWWGDEPGVTPENGQLIVVANGSQWTQTGLENGGTYFYVFTSYGAGGESPPSAQHQVSLAPNAPDVVAATAGDGFVTVDWEPSFGALTYNLYVGTTDGVTPATGTLIENVTAPYTDTNVVNGDMYYYVVTAVGWGGEGPASSQVAGRPLPTPVSPIGVTATVTEEAPGSLTITWSAPAIGADSYTIYWSTTPGVTPATGTAIAGATSPYVHTGLAGRTTYYYVLTSTLYGVESPPSTEVSATPVGPPSGSGNGSGGGEPPDEGFGNNLSVPVVFADGIGVTGAELGTNATPWLDTATGLRPFAGEDVDPFPNFAASEAVVLNGVTYYPQKTAASWQADWRDGSGELQEVTVDWGDNLGSQSFRTTSVVRIETTLYQDTTDSAPDDTMTAYPMTLLSGSRTTELQGTTGLAYESNVRTVFTTNARLRIQKLQGQGGAVDESVPGVDIPVAGTFGTDGPGGYGAEINVAGKLVYGYVWQLRNVSVPTAQKQGWWRISFEVDAQSDVNGRNVPRNLLMRELHASDDGKGGWLSSDGTVSTFEIQIN